MSLRRHKNQTDDTEAEDDSDLEDPFACSGGSSDDYKPNENEDDSGKEDEVFEDEEEDPKDLRELLRDAGTSRPIQKKLRKRGKYNIQNLQRRRDGTNTDKRKLQNKVDNDQRLIDTTSRCTKRVEVSLVRLNFSPRTHKAENDDRSEFRNDSDLEDPFAGCESSDDFQPSENENDDDDDDCSDRQDSCDDNDEEEDDIIKSLSKSATTRSKYNTKDSRQLRVRNGTARRNLNMANQRLCNINDSHQRGITPTCTKRVEVNLVRLKNKPGRRTTVNRHYR